MRLHRFFLKEPLFSRKELLLSHADLVHQLRRVFRLHEGDRAIFFDGLGNEYESELVFVNDEKGGETLGFRVLEARQVKPFTDKKLSLALSLIKKDNFEWVIQKGTELGVTEFMPLLSDRSEKKGFNMERARKIMIEACEQSGRADIPSILEPIALADFLAAEKRPMVAFHTDGAAFDRANFADAQEIVACIGPEGGWTDEEVKKFKEHGVSLARLDTPVLRAETAAIAVATILLVG